MENPEVLGPTVTIERKFKDGSTTHEQMPAWLAEITVANISAEEPLVTSAKILYSKLTDYQQEWWAKGKAAITTFVNTKFFKPNNLIS